MESNERGYLGLLALLFILTSVALSLGVGLTLYRNQENFKSLLVSNGLKIEELEPVSLSSKAKNSAGCEQVTTIACVKNSPLCKDFSSPCDVPEGWEIIHKIK